MQNIAKRLGLDQHFAAPVAVLERHATKDIGHAPVLVLRPLFQRVVVASATGDRHAQESHRSRFVEIGLDLQAELFHGLVARPTEHSLLTSRVHESHEDGIGDVGGDPRREEGVPAAGVWRILLGAARNQRLPIHGLHVDLEAGPLHQRLGDRRQVGEYGKVG